MQIIYPEQYIQTTQAYDPDVQWQGVLAGEFEEDWDIPVILWETGTPSQWPVRTLLMPDEWEFMND